MKSAFVEIKEAERNTSRCLERGSVCGAYVFLYGDVREAARPRGDRSERHRFGSFQLTDGI